MVVDMSLPISGTPTLRGKEADRFRRQANRNRNKCAPIKEVRKAVKLYCDVMRNSKLFKEVL
jgi:hypothetical protein